MPVYRYPTFVRENREGFFTAVPVEDLDDYMDAEEEFAGFGRTEKEIAELVARLRDEKTNILLVGERGSGKTAVAMEAARRVSNADGRGRVRFWTSSADRLIAGMKYLGQWEKRCEEVVEELEEADGVLCVEKLLDLVRTGGKGPVDSVGAFFVPYLKSGELRMVAEATPMELDACARLLPGLADQFKILRIEAMDRTAVLSLFSRAAENVLASRKIETEREVFDFVYRLFARFHTCSAFPGQASRFLQRLFDRALREKREIVTVKDAAEAFTAASGLPEKLVDDDWPLTMEEILAGLKAEVIGQDEACRIAAEIVATFKAGMNDPARPAGVLLFCGPTGVGKTQLAKTITDYCFGHGKEKNRLIRLDMSEYSGYDAASRLTGDPVAGESKMIREIRRRPFSVLLFDEIEKASPAVFDVLLDILDEGRFTDAYGMETNFESAIIIMTSNLGVESASPVGFDDRTAGGFEKKVKAFFRPEFFNRIDEIVPFGRLTMEDVRKIAEKELRNLAEREGVEKRGIEISWSPALLDRLAEIGFHPKFGARNLQRTIEEKAAVPLARYLLENPGLSNARLLLDTDGTGKTGEVRVSESRRAWKPATRF